MSHFSGLVVLTEKIVQYAATCTANSGLEIRYVDIRGKGLLEVRCIFGIAKGHNHSLFTAFKLYSVRIGYQRTAWSTVF